jgi:hypothetical protein
MIDFDDPKLIAMHGNSWVDVQVAFYDFIWKTATAIEVGEFNEKVLAETRQRIEVEGFHDDAPFFNSALAALKNRFKTADEAWDVFVGIHYS